MIDFLLKLCIKYFMKRGHIKSIRNVQTMEMTMNDGRIVQVIQKTNVNSGWFSPVSVEFHMRDNDNILGSESTDKVIKLM